VIWPYPFNIDQRLLTEARIVIHYLGWISLLNPEPMSLYHTDFQISNGLLRPTSTLLSIIAIIFLVLAGLYSLVKQRYPLIGFGLLWFFAGHLLESTTIPLELMFEHRNYLPSLGILLIPAYVLVHMLESHSQNPSRKTVIIFALLILTAFLCHERVTVWRDEKSFILDLITKKQDDPWAWAEMGNYLNKAGDYAHAVESMRTAARLAPAEPAFMFGEAYIRCQHQPGMEFPEDFSSKLSSALQDNPVTPSSVNTLVNMIKTCLSTTANDTTLRLLYSDAGRHDMKVIADIGRQALALLDAKQARD
jgi:hypothetical protein